MPAPPVGLDITSNALIAVSLKKRGKGYSLVRHAIAPLEHGIVGEGEVLDVERLSNAIREFWQREGIKDKNVAVGVANQRCVMRTIDLPFIKNKKQVRDTLSFQIEDNLPIPLDEAVFDFHTVETFKDETTGVQRQRHVVVMAYRESMQRFHDAITGAGLKPRHIDFAAFAIMRAGLRSVLDNVATFANEDADPNHKPVIAFCDIGDSTTNLVVTRGDMCDMNRIVSFGTRMFSQTLCEQFGWTTVDADRVRTEAGIVPLGGVESPGDPYSDSRKVLQFVADQFAQELSTTFDYYHHQADGAHRIERIVLAGEGALLRGIEERFATELGIPVSILDASPHLDGASVDELGVNHAQYGTALGLAMEDAA